MNYLTNMKNVTKLSQQELHNTGKSSWHDQYKDSAWIFIGGLPFDLTEGDIICVFSQYGEVVNINLIRAKDTGKSKGFCFLCYEDQRSTILAVDNLNGIKIMNRAIRVDHVQEYKVPKDDKKANVETKKLYAEGCAPKPVAPIIPKAEPERDKMRETLADQIEHEIKLPARLPIYTNIKKEHVSDTETEKPAKKEKRKKDKKKKSKKKSKEARSDDDLSSSDSEDEVKMKKDKRSDEHINKSQSNTESTSYSRSEKREHGSNKKKQKHFGSPKRRDRSRSKEKTEEKKTYRNDFSPSIPKRWR